MLEFDINLLSLLNSQIGKSPVFDSVTVYLSGANLFKATPMVFLLWGIWFSCSADQLRRRKDVILVFFSSFIAMATARLLALVLPFRVRPLHNPDLLLRIPEEMERGLLETWSSMPSDHAALAFALATGIFLIHRSFGVLALLHATLVICLPRAYLSLHYPTDLIVGAIVGMAAAWTTLRMANTHALVAGIMRFEKVRPASFYIFFLFIASQMLEMFDGVRGLAHVLLHAARNIVRI
jgi:undecaprenyl-diphosphatase